MYISLATAVTALVIATCAGICKQQKTDKEKAEYISREKLNIPQINADGTVTYHKLRVTRFKYEDHYYIGFDQNDAEDGIVHDPDCFTCKQNATEEHQRIYEAIIGEIREKLKDSSDNIEKLIKRSTTSILNKLETDIDYE